MDSERSGSVFPDQRDSRVQSDDSLSSLGVVWPEVERAERLADGAALKWASGIFSSPQHLEHVAQYRKRERQRTAMIYSRLKSQVQSYVDGVGWGVLKLREARADLHESAKLLLKANQSSSRNLDMVRSLEKLREVSVGHAQLLAAVNNLPCLYSVRSMVSETERLVESRRLLEAHARLMQLECWQDDVLWQLHGKLQSADDQALVKDFFSGVTQLVDTLGREIWAVVSSALTLALQNPTPFVSAVRIVEREEALDQALMDERGRAGGRPLPPDRPRCWRACFFKVLEEAVCARFRSVSHLPTRGPGLAGHLSALQHGIMSDVATVGHFLEHCVPEHYHLTAAYLKASHFCLHAHLAQVISWDLESGEIFAVLYWVLHIYTSAEMMGHPELASVLNGEDLGALITTEGLEELQHKYVSGVRSRVSEWMHKAMVVEVQDWQKELEPETDHEGFYHTSLPTIITQMLEENSQVARMIGPSLQDRIVQMGLYEIEVLLNRFREALVEYGKEHRRGLGNKKFYLHYLLASISNFVILKKSTETLQQQLSPCALGQFSRTPPNPLTALDRTVRRACCLVLEELKLNLAPCCGGLLTRDWPLHGDAVPKVCSVLEQHVELYKRVRPPCRQWLQDEARWLLVREYVRALMQKRVVCHGPNERRQLAEQMLHDEQSFSEIFCAEGESSNGPLALIPVLADFFRLKDPGLLALDVSGLVTKYPDISGDHVSVLLDIRGDVTRELRSTLRDLLEQSAPSLPPEYRPIFIDIPVSPSAMTFCLPTAKCT